MSDSITCISIIFAFSQSFLLATYANKDINIYMKKHNMFDRFIKDNRRFITFCLYSLMMLFLLNLFSFEWKYECLNLSPSHFAFLITLIQLDYTLTFARKYMNVYKNSYSDKVIENI